MVQLEGDWKRDGFVIARQLLPEGRVARLRDVAESCLEQWRASTPGDHHSVPHLNDPAFHRPGSADFVELMETVADTTVLELLRRLLGTEPLFGSVSLFCNPTSSSVEGAWHRVRNS